MKGSTCPMCGRTFARRSWLMKHLAKNNHIRV